MFEGTESLLNNINNRERTTTSVENDLGIWISNNLTWTKHVIERCTKANKMLGFVKRSGVEISNIRTRRTLYLSVVRPVLGYGTQVWCPQSISLVRRTERIQRRASKFLLKLPYLCTETYHERLTTLKLMPLSYWHEYMDLVFFFKAVNGLVYISEDILPKPTNPARVTRSSTTNGTKFRPRKCKIVTSTFLLQPGHQNLEYSTIKLHRK